MGRDHSPEFLTLTALASGPRHGYGLLKEIERLSSGRVRVRTSSLYAMLERMEAAGSIEEAGTQVVGGRLRRMVVLTEAGRARLAREAGQMAADAAEATRRLDARGFEQ